MLTQQNMKLTSETNILERNWRRWFYLNYTTSRLPEKTKFILKASEKLDLNNIERDIENCSYRKELILPSGGTAYLDI